MHRVFLSSSFKDLIEERRCVIEVLRKMNIPYEAMEEYPAGIDARVFCKEKLRESSIFVIVIAHRYGTIIEDEMYSYTEMEYNIARERGILILPFIPHQNMKFNVDQVEQDDNRRKLLSAFREEVLQRVSPGTYNSPDHLAALVSSNLFWHITRQDANTEIASRIRESGIPYYIITRTQKALRECVQLCNKLHKDAAKDLLDIYQAQKAFREELLKIRLRFDGQITCLTDEMICTHHEDPTLIGRSLLGYVDINGKQIFKGLKNEAIGNLIWHDEFSRDDLDVVELDSIQA